MSLSVCVITGILNHVSLLIHDTDIHGSENYIAIKNTIPVFCVVNIFHG